MTVSLQEHRMRGVAKSIFTDADLFTAYERTCQEVDAVCRIEETRRLRLQRILLEDENQDLHAQLEEDDGRIDRLETSILDIQTDLDVALRDSEAAQRDLKTRTREVENLKVEISSLNDVSLDSNKILSEKLKLSRELSSLKPELEHLRSLASSHQILLSEKLALQRQTNTLQVELDNEKRSTQRRLSNYGRAQADDAKLEASLEAARAELAKEKRDRQKAERQHQKSTADLENRISTLESKLDDFRTKLRSTKDTLKETQAELQRAQNARSNAAKGAGPGARKRNVSEVNADIMIGTPGDLPAAKRSKINQALPGEKSTFSITPFLNRTMSVPPESPGPPSKEDDSNGKSQAHADSPSRSTLFKPLRTGSKTQDMEPQRNKERETQRIREENPEAKQTKQALGKKTVAKAPQRKASAAPKLAQVAEEEAEESVGAPTVSATAPETSSSSTAANLTTVEESTVEGTTRIEKKKRRLLGGGLGKTLFDEDEGDRNPVATARKGIGSLGRSTSLKGPKLGAKVATGFGAISPLKKDKRAAQG